MALFGKWLRTVDGDHPKIGLRQIMEQIIYVQQTVERRDTAIEKRLRALEEKKKEG